MNREDQAAQSVISELAAKAEKQQAIQQLTELVAHLEEARECSRNLGRMYEFMHEDEKGRLMVRFFRKSRDEARQPGGMYRCLVRWGDVWMLEDCYSMVYDHNDEQHPLKFLFAYFYTNQNLYVMPEQLKASTLHGIIDWIKKTINY